MSASDHDDTDMTPEEFDAAMQPAVPVVVRNLGDVDRLLPRTGSSNVTIIEQWTAT